MPPALANAPTDDEITDQINRAATDNTPFYVTGGTLPPTALSYIARQADTDLFEALRAGHFCYVLNTRQIGKSSLMIRTVRRLKESGAAVVVLDLTAIGQNLSAEQWYDGLLVMLSEQLHLEDECEDFWLQSDNLGPMQRFFAVLGQVVLPKVGADRPLIIFVDEIDSVRSLPFSADEFFAGIRECYNRRVQNPEYHRVTFCLLGVANPADLIQDTRMSPFNIGRRVTLRDFTPIEAAPLAQGMGLNGKRLLERALYWTGGHPYLTQRLCRELSNVNAQSVGEVDRVCERLFLSKRAIDTDDNLSFVQNRMLRSEYPLPDVLDFYGKLRSGKRIKDDETNDLCGLLRLAGIAKVDVRTETLSLRNRIYETVFDKSWVLKHMPDAELRRQRQAVWTGALRAASIFALFIVAMGIMLVRVISSEKQAQVEKKHAIEQRAKADANARAADSAQKVAKENATRAERNEESARKSEQSARLNEERAQREKLEADRQRQLAEESKKRADAEAAKAVLSAEEAKASEAKAVTARIEAERQGEVARAASKKAIEARTAAEKAAAAEHIARQNAVTALDKLSDANKARIRRLKEFVDEHPTDILLPQELARLYMDQKDYPQAQVALSELIRRKSDLYPAYADRGLCYLIFARNTVNDLVKEHISPDTSPAEYQPANQGFQNAIQDFTTFLNHTSVIPSNSTMVGSAYAGRAEAYRNLKSYSAALMDLAAQERIGSPPVEEIERGQDYLNLQKYNQAVEAFSKVLVRHGTDPISVNQAQGYFWIAVTRQQQGDYNAAYTAFGLYQEYYPSFEPVYEYRVACLLASNRWADVIKECRRYQQVFPQTAKMYPWQANAYLMLGNRKGYRALCTEGMARFGTEKATAENANYVAWTCALGPDGLTDYSNALRIAARAVADAEKQALTPGRKNETALGALWANRNTHAALLYRAGKYPEAIQELEQCEAIPRTFDPNDRFGDYILLAMAQARSGNQPEAATWLQKAKSIITSPGVEQQIFLKETEALVK